jgi:hypothetical protein
MPTPAQIKATKKSIKAWIKELNKKTEGNLAYNNIKEDIAQIYKIENEAERYQMIREYELIVRNQISDHFFDRRTVIHSSRSLIDKYSKQQITSTPPSAIVDGVRRIVNLFCSLHEEDFAKKHPMTREKADEELNWTLDEISKRNYYDEMPKFFKEWDTACVRQEIENFKVCEAKGRELLARMEVLSHMGRPGRLDEENRRRLAACGAKIRDERPLDSVMERDVVTNYHIRQILKLRRELLDVLNK